MYRMRLHGRGGQGIKTAGNVLGRAFFRAGFEVQDAPRYGAERRGAPIAVYVRAAQEPIHERGVITHPDLVVVADPTIIGMTSAGVLQGAGRQTVLLVHDDAPPVLWHERLAFPGTVLTLGRDGANVGRHTAAMACAGAAARLTGAIPRAELEAAVRQELAALPPDDLPDNVDAALAGYDAMHANASIVTQGQPPTADALPRPKWIDLPADPARIAAPDIREPATSLRANTGLWRESRPVIDFDRCNRCSWICSTLCPDSAIAVDEARVPSIDYAHCKGCMVCVAVCPANAISIQREADALAGAGS